MGRSLHRTAAGIAAFFAFLLIAAAAKGAPADFKLGVAVCLSGGCAEWGSSALKGVQLAVEEINRSGGINGREISIQAEDTAEAISGVNAVNAFQRLLANKEVHYIVGPSWSPAGLALIPVLVKRPDVS